MVDLSQHAPERGVVHPEVAVIGASAGGVEAITSLARGLSADLPLAIVIVLHMPLGASSRLPMIVGRAGALPAVAAEHRQQLRQGHIYVAPPDRHLVLDGPRILLLDGPRENGFRPAIDPLFRSAARTLGRRAIGVVLSGTLDDGAAGLAAIAAMGGAAIVQDPTDALCASLPEACLEAVPSAAVATASGIAELLDDLAVTPVEALAASTDRAVRQLLAEPGDLPAEGVDLSCPDCGGALQVVQAGPVTRYRCRVGHVLSSQSLLSGMGQQLEAALWAAVRTLEETATISRRLAERSNLHGATAAARRFEARQADAANRADLVRQAIEAFNESVNETTDAALADRTA